MTYRILLNIKKDLLYIKKDLLIPAMPNEYAKVMINNCSVFAANLLKIAFSRNLVDILQIEGVLYALAYLEIH